LSITNVTDEAGFDIPAAATFTIIIAGQVASAALTLDL
jgi:hypothetical protein